MLRGWRSLGSARAVASSRWTSRTCTTLTCANPDPNPNLGPSPNPELNPTPNPDLALTLTLTTLTPTRCATSCCARARRWRRAAGGEMLCRKSGLNGQPALTRPKRLIGRGSPRHALALNEASGAPAGRGLSQLVFDTGGTARPRPRSSAPSRWSWRRRRSCLSSSGRRGRRRRRPESRRWAHPAMVVPQSHGPRAVCP